MSGKKDTENRDKDGFFVLHHKEERNAEGFFELRRQKEKSQAPTTQEKPSPEKQEVPSAIPQKAEKAKKGKNKKSRETQEFLSWYYDDGHTIGYVIKSKSGFCDPALLKNEADFNKANERLKERKAKIKWHKLPVGVEIFSKYYRCKFQLNPPNVASAFEAFKKMAGDGLNSEDRLPILKLICVVLSSYIIRSLLELDDIVKDFKLDDRSLRAINMVALHSENGFYDLQQICQSMIVSTAVDDRDWSELAVPTAISPEHDQSITECTYLRVCGYKKYKWPAPYRDTSVLFDSRTAKDKELTELAALNPWCSFVVYGRKNLPPKMLGYSEIIDSRRIELTLSNQELLTVHDLVGAYVAAIPSRFAGEVPQLIKAWLTSGEHLQRYADTVAAKKKGSLSDVERFKLRVEISSFLYFLWFVNAQKAVPVEDVRVFWNSVLETLLPGYIVKVGIEGAEGSESAESAFAPVLSPQKMFEELLQKMLTHENLTHFYPISQGKNALWPELTESGVDVWGYIKSFRWENTGSEEPCLVLLKDKLVSLNQELDWHFPSFNHVLTEIRSKELKYIHESKNVKFRRTPDDDYIQPAAFRLRITDLPIDKDVKEMLLSKTAEQSIITTKQPTQNHDASES